MLLGFVLVFLGFCRLVLDFHRVGNWTEFVTCTVIFLVLMSARGVTLDLHTRVKTANTIFLQSFSKAGDTLEKLQLEM